MNKVIKTSVAIMATAMATSAWTADGQAADQAMESFEREFAHQPAPASEITRKQIPNDVLYRAVNGPLQSRDKVRASFERAFSESQSTPLREPGNDADILTMRFNASLWSDDTLSSPEDTD